MALGTIFGVASAVTGIAGGIFGASQADSSNKAAKKAQKQAERNAERQADITNEYNKKVFEAEKKNYFAQREYQYDTAMQQWRYNQNIQDYNERQAARQYDQSTINYVDQLKFNNVAAAQAYESEQAALNEIMSQQAFQGEGLYIDRLQSQGKAALLQAGNSRSKAMQSTLGEFGRNMAVLDASLTSAVTQTGRNMRDISTRRYSADMNAKAQVMLRPEQLPMIPQPTQAPERIFVEPAEVIPGAVPPAIQQSTFTPVLQGITSATSTLAGINWGGPKPST